ncbi:quinol monooxygenase YgiN [Hamadaea flava]|uniref:Quinol monooxygenase n=1 Tax=Hamadaea flava TaxID=1742688 RepID=A0ABV8LM55_9ACTN|nr:putative quinol monooxygenase [Hamadaea flava]MCP2321573.1 quinol monooxygenase YgiN [Hamadaea flava]
MTTSSAGPIALYGFLTAKPGHADVLRRRLADLVEPSRGHEGNLQYHLHEQSDGRFFLYEQWRSQADLDRHNATEVLREFLAEAPEHLDGGPEAYFGELLSSPVG